MSTLAIVLIVAGVVLLYAVAQARRLEREAERERRRQIFDERVASNGLNPERRLEAKATTRTPPRASGR